MYHPENYCIPPFHGKSTTFSSNQDYNQQMLGKQIDVDSVIVAHLQW